MDLNVNSNNVNEMQVSVYMPCQFLDRFLLTKTTKFIHKVTGIQKLS